MSERDRPERAEETEVTPGMIDAGLLAIAGELLSWEDAGQEEKRRALNAAYRAMLRSSLGEES